MFYPIVKEQDFLSSRKEYRQTPILQMSGVSVNHDDKAMKVNFFAIYRSASIPLLNEDEALAL